MPGASSLRGPALAHLVGCVDRGERALKAAHLLRASIGLEVSTKQVIVTILDRCQLVVFRSKLIRIVAEDCALTGEEVVVGIIAEGIEVGRIAAGLALTWGSSAAVLELIWGFNSGAYQRRTRLTKEIGPPCWM